MRSPFSTDADREAAAPCLKVRRRSRAFLAGLLVATVISAPLAMAEPIMLRPGTNIYASGVPLDVGDHAIPCVADWNGDGRKDLLLGYRATDKVALYLNSGSDAQPAFTSFSNLQAGGVDIYQAGSGCGAPAPWVCDYDADGKRDLLVGNGTDGKVYFYRNTNTDAQPILSPGVSLMVGASPLTVTFRATPYVCDWDGDWLNDLLCGNGNGNVYFFKNGGTAQSPTNTAEVLLQAGGGILSFGSRSAVRVFDWDGDGFKDLIGSSSTGVYWCRNTNNNTSPKLQAAVALRAPVSGSGLTPINVAGSSPRMRLEVVDWNNDGVAGLLVGNDEGLVFYFEGYHFAFTRIAPQAGGQFTLQWNSASFLKYNVLAGQSPDDVRSLAVTNLTSQGKTTSWTTPLQGDQRFYKVQVAP